MSEPIACPKCDGKDPMELFRTGTDGMQFHYCNRCSTQVLTDIHGAILKVLPAK